jgi:hypothetical protein
VDLLKRLDEILGIKKVFTPMELVNMGLYGGNSTVHHEIKKGNLEAIRMTERRIVITRKSIIDNIMERNCINDAEKFLLQFQ